MELEDKSHKEVKEEFKPFGFMNKFYQHPFIKRNLIPIVILYLGLFMFAAGYIVHEQLSGYYCTVAYNEWSDSHILKIPLDNFSAEMDKISGLPNFKALSIDEKEVAIPIS